MPTTAPAIKVDGVKRWGAEVILEGTTSADRRTRAEAEVAARGLVMVPPFDHEWIIEGQGTCGLEILEQVPDVDVVVVPVGGGGLVSGVAAAVKLSATRRRQSSASSRRAPPKMTASLAAGHPVTLDAHARHRRRSDARAARRSHVRARARVRRSGRDGRPTTRSREAALWLFFEAKQVVEPSGAATVAAVLWPEQGSPLADRDRKVVAILSGGNVAPQSLASLHDGAMGQ